MQHLSARGIRRLFRSVALFASAIVATGVPVGPAVAAQAAADQEIITISGGPTCERCAIERILLATIHDRSFDGGALVGGGAVHVNRDGTFLVRAGRRMEELFLADESGSITRQIGRSGEGPGEYFRPLSVAELPQAYVVFDPALGRVTWLDKESFEVSRTVRMPAANTGTAPAVFSDGSYVLGAALPTRGGNDLPLHLVTADGDVLRSFGEGPYSTNIAPSGDSAVWVAQVDRYRVAKWHIDGRLLAVYERVADWFPPPADNRSRQAGDRSVRLTEISEDEQGRLWVHTSIRTLREVRGVDATTGQERSVLRLSPDPATAQEVIEVLDPVTGVVRSLSAQVGQRLALTQTDLGFVQILDASGVQVGRVPLPSSIAVTEDDIAAERARRVALAEARERMFAELSGDPVSLEDIAERVASIPANTFAPPIDRVSGDLDGRLWLRLFRPGAEWEEWQVWDIAEGDAVLEFVVALPLGEELLDAAGNRVLLRQKDEMDVSYLVVREIEGYGSLR